jgi:hypothetical protein
MMNNPGTPYTQSQINYAYGSMVTAFADMRKNKIIMTGEEA